MIPAILAQAVETGRDDAVDGMLVADILLGLERVQSEGPKTNDDQDLRLRSMALIQQIRRDRWSRERVRATLATGAKAGMAAIVQALEETPEP